MPGYPTIAGSPGFVAAGTHFSILGVREFDADNVCREWLAVRHWFDLCPTLARVG